MEHLFICLLLACTCYLLYKVFRLKNRESQLKNEISVLRIAEAKAQERLDEMEASYCKQYPFGNRPPVR